MGLDLIQIGGIILSVLLVGLALYDTQETGGKRYGKANTNNADWRDGEGQGTHDGVKSFKIKK